MLALPFLSRFALFAFSSLVDNFSDFAFSLEWVNPCPFHLIISKVIREEQPKRDWIDLNFQMINTRRQLSFETRNTSNYKVGNNNLSNRLSSLNKKIQLQDLNLPFESYKIKCKMMFLNQVWMCVLVLVPFYITLVSIAQCYILFESFYVRSKMLF